ncbi:MAG TPA: response regulator [Bacteroidia bacterium]|jgi:CheY-like chemotaxis protein
MRELLIYVVDDDMDERFFIERAFDSFKYKFNLEVSSFFHGKHLIDALNEKSTPLPGLILMDLNMPVMNGFETLEALKKTSGLNTIPVIIHSSVKTEDSRKKCMALGAAKVVTKPGNMLEYPSVLKELVFEQIHLIGIKA